MQTYQASDPPHDTEPKLRDWLRRETGSIQTAANTASDTIPIRVLNVAPTRPRDGFYRADGTNWDPGSGAGVYEYTSSTATWTKIGSASSSGPTGGATLSAGSQTLTSASAKALRCAFSTHGQGITLPSATTLTAGATIFSLYNPTAYFGYIKDNGGTTRGFIAPYTGVEVDLNDASTANGTWSFDGAALYGLTMVYRSTVSQGSGTQSRFGAFALDSSRTMLVWGTQDIRAVVWNDSTGVAGTEVSVRASLGTSLVWTACSQTTDQVMVVSVGTLTAMEAVILSVSTNTITVNSGTKGTATLAGTAQALGEVVNSGGCFVVPYNRATTTQGLRGITVSGVTPGIGAELATSTTGNGSADPTQTPHVYSVSSGVILAIGITAAGAAAAYGKCCTISGNTLTNTSTATGGAGSFFYRTFAMGGATPRWMIVHGDNGTASNASLFSVSGSTVTASSVTSVIAGMGSFNSLLQSDAILVSSTKVLFANAISSTTFSANILTDTAGTLSKGTSVTCDNLSGSSELTIVSSSGTNVRILCPTYLSGQTVSVNNSGLNGHIYTIDCSTANPAISVADQIVWGLSARGFCHQPYNGVRHTGTTRCSAGWATVVNRNWMTGPLMVIGDSEVFGTPQAPLYTYASNVGQMSANYGIAGGGVLSDYSSWMGNFTTNGGRTFGAIFRIEGAQ